MPDPTLQEVLLRKASSVGPDPMAGPIQNYPGAKIGQMPFMGAPGKLTGLFGSPGQLPEDAKHVGGLLNRITEAEPESSPVLDYLLGWAGLRGDPSAYSAAEEMIRLGQAKAAGAAIDLGRKANASWRDYTGHNLIPSAHGVINKLLGTNYGNGQP